VPNSAGVASEDGRKSRVTPRRASIDTSARRASMPQSEHAINEVTPVLSDDHTSDETLFELHPQYAATGPITNDRFFRLRHVSSGFWLHFKHAVTSTDAPLESRLVATRQLYDEASPSFPAHASPPAGSRPLWLAYLAGSVKSYLAAR
jgi:hypothetical protein